MKPFRQTVSIVFRSGVDSTDGRDWRPGWYVLPVWNGSTAAPEPLGGPYPTRRAAIGAAVRHCYAIIRRQDS